MELMEQDADDHRPAVISVLRRFFQKIVKFTRRNILSVDENISNFNVVKGLDA